MKTTLQTKQPVVPAGWTGDLKFFNRWVKSINKEVDKVMKTDVASKLTV